jgi:hypothetical protein
MPAVAALLPHLTELNLWHTGVTDAGVEHLSRLNGLVELRVPTRVSGDAARKAMRWDGAVDIITRDPIGKVVLL